MLESDRTAEVATGLVVHQARAAEKVTKDSILYRQGDGVSNIFQVKVGLVRVYSLFPDGRRHILSFHDAGEWFGLECGVVHRQFAEAATDCEIWRIPLSALVPSSVYLTSLVLENVASTRDRHSTMLCQKSAARLAAFILEIAAKTGQSHFVLPMSRADIADYLGMTVESVARSFSLLTRKRLVCVGGFRQREISIVNVANLRALRGQR